MGWTQRLERVGSGSGDGATSNRGGLKWKIGGSITHRSQSVVCLSVSRALSSLVSTVGRAENERWWWWTGPAWLAERTGDPERALVKVGESWRGLPSQHVHDDSFLVSPSQIWEANYLRVQGAWSTHIIYAQNGGKTNPVR